MTRKKKIIVTGSCILALLIIVLALEMTSKTHLFHDRSIAHTASDAAKGSTMLTNAAGGTTNKTDTSSRTQSSGTASGSGTDFMLNTPTGIFVSNHHPNLSGSPAPNQINSDCTTTSGATCTIVFTKGSAVKSLPPEITDNGGSAYWTWRLQDIGLTEGTWKVQAKATFGSQTKTAYDLMDLVVKE
jgi:hypothetical protein